MRKNNLKVSESGSKGFSLVELMVALLIGLIVLLGASQIFITGLQSFKTMDALAKRQETLRYVVDVMSDDVRSAFNGTSQNPNAPPTEVVVSSDGTSIEIQYFDPFTLRGREGIPYCQNSSGTNQLAPFVDGVDDVYNVKYEIDNSTGELKVSFRCGWLESGSPDPVQVFADGGAYSTPSAVADGIETMVFSRPASGAKATIGVQLELPPLSENDQIQLFEFVITNRIKALSSINAGL